MPHHNPPKERVRDPARLLPSPQREPSLTHLHMSDLLSRAADLASLLARKELELARVEVEADLKKEAKTAASLGVSSVFALLTISLLLVAVVFGLVEAGLPGWAASLIVAAAVLLAGTIVGVLGWRARVKEPMQATRRTLREGMDWAKELR